MVCGFAVCIGRFSFLVSLSSKAVQDLPNEEDPLWDPIEAPFCPFGDFITLHFRL